MFLDWLLDQIRQNDVHLLVVAGDVFDQANPPQASLALYYHFLQRLTTLTECHAVIVGGNHDSAAMLDAPRGLLSALRVKVIGAAPATASACVLDLGSVVVAAVPFLRERDLRLSVAGQPPQQVAAEIRAGITSYYQEALLAANRIAAGRPVIATGHLTTAEVNFGGSEREIHIGNLGAVDCQCFQGFDYVALGHIHRPQWIQKQDQIRYAGSPIPLSFDESEIDRQVLLITLPELAGHRFKLKPIKIPKFRYLQRINCTFEEIGPHLISFEPATLQAWIEWNVSNGAGNPELEPAIRLACEKAGVIPLKFNFPRHNAALTDPFDGRELGELNPVDIFTERLNRAGIEPNSEDGQGLLLSFDQLLSRMDEEGVSAS